MYHSNVSVVAKRKALPVTGSKVLSYMCGCLLKVLSMQPASRTTRLTSRDRVDGVTLHVCQTLIVHHQDETVGYKGKGRNPAKPATHTTASDAAAGNDSRGACSALSSPDLHLVKHSPPAAVLTGAHDWGSSQGLNTRERVSRVPALCTCIGILPFTMSMVVHQPSHSSTTKRLGRRRGASPGRRKLNHGTQGLLLISRRITTHATLVERVEALAQVPERALACMGRQPLSKLKQLALRPRLLPLRGRSVSLACSHRMLQLHVLMIVARCRCLPAATNHAHNHHQHPQAPRSSSWYTWTQGLPGGAHRMAPHFVSPAPGCLVDGYPTKIS